MIANLEAIVERIVADWASKNGIRDASLERSRQVIRFCANSIRATHRHEYDTAGALLGQARAGAAEMCAEAEPYADIYYSGYVQDALKELAEAAISLALVQGQPVPEPEAIGVPYAAYLNGLGEAIGEMRRFALDAIRRDDVAEAERIMGIMDEAYGLLVTIDFPDTLTRGLRRTTDMVRGVTERTRGDLTTAVRQEKLQEALRAFEDRYSAPGDSSP